MRDKYTKKEIFAQTFYHISKTTATNGITYKVENKGGYVSTLHVVNGEVARLYKND